MSKIIPNLTGKKYCTFIFFLQSTLCRQKTKKENEVLRTYLKAAQDDISILLEEKKTLHDTVRSLQVILTELCFWDLRYLPTFHKIYLLSNTFYWYFFLILIEKCLVKASERPTLEKNVPLAKLANRSSGSGNGCVFSWRASFRSVVYADTVKRNLHSEFAYALYFCFFVYR